MTKLKVPKKVGGVKLPKELRRQAKKAMKLTESAAVRELAMAGLALAAEKMIERARPSGAAARAAASNVIDHGPGKMLKDSLAALELGDVVRAAAVEGARRFLAGFEEAGRTRRASAKPSAAKAKAKAKATAKPARSSKASAKARTAKAPAKAAAAKPAKSAKAPGAAKPAAAAKPRKPTLRAAASRAKPAHP